MSPLIDASPTPSHPRAVPTAAPAADEPRPSAPEAAATTSRPLSVSAFVAVPADHRNVPGWPETTVATAYSTRERLSDAHRKTAQEPGSDGSDKNNGARGDSGKGTGAGHAVRSPLTGGVGTLSDDDLVGAAHKVARPGALEALAPYVLECERRGLMARIDDLFNVVMPPAPRGRYVPVRPPNAPRRRR